MSPSVTIECLTPNVPRSGSNVGLKNGYSD
jgi:hypothetical protein